MTPKKTPKPSKPTRGAPIKILLTTEERDALTTAAGRAGVPLATWVRMVALAAAR